MIKRKPAISLTAAFIIVSTLLAPGSLLAPFAGLTFAQQPDAAAPAATKNEATKTEATRTEATRARATNRDQWYALMLMGKKSGFIHSTTIQVGDVITSGSNLVIAMKREALKIEIGIDSTFTETADGKPISMKSVRRLSTIPTTETVEFGPAEMTITTDQGGAKTVTRRPMPKEPFLPPAAAERYMADEQRKGNKTIVVRTIDASDGPSFVTITRKIGEPTTVDVMGKTVPAIKASSTVDKYPGIMTEEYLSENGDVLRTVVNLGGIKMEQLLADRELALAEKDGPELLVSTTVKLDKPIKNARELSRGEFVLTVTEGKLPELPSVGFQTVVRVSDTASRVTIDLSKGGSALTEEEENSPDFMAASSMVNWKDESVEKLLRQALHKEIPDEAARAEALRKFVHQIISTKDMSVGFASASEVSRTLTGDCTEHAVLLAALLRGANIRSRVVSGLVYVDAFGGEKNVFGYHMWTQAVLPTADGPRWVDLDSALGIKQSFDATHITLGTSSLADGQTQNYLVTLAPMIGRLIIKAAK